MPKRLVAVCCLIAASIAFAVPHMNKAHPVVVYESSALPLDHHSRNRASRDVGDQFTLETTTTTTPATTTTTITPAVHANAIPPTTSTSARAELPRRSTRVQTQPPTTFTAAAARVTGVTSTTSTPANVEEGSPRAIGEQLAADAGWSDAQWTCLEALWDRESGWSVHAANRRSGAYGIPQALPASKMRSAGEQWHDDAATQISWGLAYIEGRWGTPCAADAHQRHNGWY